MHWKDNEISIDGACYRLPYPVLRAIEYPNRVVVLFDPDADRRQFGQFRNVVALDRRGNEIWKAELPTTISGDCYYHVASIDPLTAYSVKSFTCEIDVGNGRLLSSVFTK